MLIYDRLTSTSQAKAIWSLLFGKGIEPVELQTGIYQINHFGSSEWPKGFQHFPNIDHEPYSSYGVADSVEQILATYPELVSDLRRRFIVTVTPVTRSTQPSEGGWRWEKWGPYIGTRTQTADYLYDEVEIDLVLCYAIHEKLP